MIYHCDDLRRYTGKERDTESGLDYFGARYYGSSMGRFQSPDDPTGIYANPLNPQSWNLYSYVQNNPVKNVDPDGHDCVTDNGNSTVSINSGDCSGKDPNNEYYYNCDGCLTGTTSANLTSNGSLALYNGSTNTVSTISGYGNQSFGPFDGPANQAGLALLSNTNNGVEDLATPLMGFLYIAVPGMLESEIPMAGLGIGGVGAAGLSGAHSDYADVTTGKSIPNSQTNVTPRQFGDNLKANGFSEQTRGNVTIYTKGDTQYTVYPQATSTGGPTAQVKVGGEVVGKIRLQ